VGDIAIDHRIVYANNPVFVERGDSKIYLDLPPEVATLRRVRKHFDDESGIE